VDEEDGDKWPLLVPPSPWNASGWVVCVGARGVAEGLPSVFHWSFRWEEAMRLSMLEVAAAAIAEELAIAVMDEVEVGPIPSSPFSGVLETTGEMIEEGASGCDSLLEVNPHGSCS